MKVLALAGGVGGAKLAYGLYHTLKNEDLTIVVNTADDFIHYGLYISPDLYTVCYTLSGLANPITGWGLDDETWDTMDALEKLKAPTWFSLGNKDLATHLERTRRRAAGETLTEITKHLCKCWGIQTEVLPMSDDPVQTMVITKEYGEISFQEYFVRYRFEPAVSGFRFKGIENAKPTDRFSHAITSSDCVVICPSNPWVSIDPILQLEGIKNYLKEKVVVAVSPIVGGKALKGPAAKMFLEMGFEASVQSVALFYRGLLNGLVIDNLDSIQKAELTRWGIISLVTNTIMKSNSDRLNLAFETIKFCRTLEK